MIPLKKALNIAAGLLLLTAACTKEPVLPAINPIATQAATYNLNQENVLINGKRITPAGASVLVGTQPTRLLLTPDGSHALVNESTWGSFPRSGNRGTYYMRVIDLASMQVKQTVRSPSGNLWHGMDLLVTDTVTLWAADGAGNNVVSFALDAANYLSPITSLAIDDCYSVDVAADAVRQRLYVTCIESDSVALYGQVRVIDLASGQQLKAVEDLLGAFNLLLDAENATLFVSSIATAARPSEGDSVWAIDLETLTVRREIKVGLGPSGMALAKGRSELYVSCNRSDDIYVIDTKALQVKNGISLHNRPQPLKGIYPVRLAVSADEDKLFVSASHENAVAIIDLAAAKVDGFIPTGWYPNDVVQRGDELIVSVGRGVGDGPNRVEALQQAGKSRPAYDGVDGDLHPDLTAPGRALRGAVTKIKLPTADELAAYSAQVEANNNVQSQYFDFSRGNDTPLPSPGAPTAASDKIKHVFFILKENFSYDAAFGDFERGNGDPDYVLWTEDVIPEQRKLAREFTIFDNFYCESDSSLDGHQWAAAGIETDFMEKHAWFAVENQFAVPAVSLTPGSVPESKLLLPHFIDQGISALGYGGLENFGVDAFGKYSANYLHDFGWTTTPERTDVARAEYFQAEFSKRLAANDMPAFSWIFLGNNHAFGLSEGEPIPEYWVGENDKAVGIVVETIANSPIWQNSLIFITEDDAQSGIDHVDKHRCPSLAIGPYVKRGYVTSVMYTINNFHKTAQLLLGSTQMHRLDERAIGMYDIFVAKPDLTPYVAVNRDVPRTLYQGGDEKLLAMSAKMDWSEIDRNPDAGEFYWRYRKSSEPPRRNPFSRFRGVVDDD